MSASYEMLLFRRIQISTKFTCSEEYFRNEEDKLFAKIYMYIPSMSASQTSSMVTLSALSKIAIFCDFLGSSTLFSCIGEGTTVRGVVSFGFGLGVFTTNNVSIISSFNLQQPKC